MTDAVNERRVRDGCDQLPAFPPVVLNLQKTLDDPDAGLNQLAHCVETNPVLAARVLALCNRAAQSAPGRRPVTTVFAALQLVGMARVRELVLSLKINDFLRELAPQSRFETLWAHSLASAVCGVELAHFTRLDVDVDASLITGLLHDVGHLWLLRFEPEGAERARQLAAQQGIDMDAAERTVLGTDHAMVGSWMAQHWGLPAPMVKGIRYHHQPQGGLPEPLVAVTHVGHILGNALRLSPGPAEPVRWISPECCKLLGLAWDDQAQSLFGRIEARSRHAFHLAQH